MRCVQESVIESNREKQKKDIIWKEIKCLTL